MDVYGFSKLLCVIVLSSTCLQILSSLCFIVRLHRFVTMCFSCPFTMCVIITLSIFLSFAALNKVCPLIILPCICSVTHLHKFVGYVTRCFTSPLLPQIDVQKFQNLGWKNIGRNMLNCKIVKCQRPGLRHLYSLV